MLLSFCNLFFYDLIFINVCGGRKCLFEQVVKFYILQNYSSMLADQMHKGLPLVTLMTFSFYRSIRDQLISFSFLQSARTYLEKNLDKFADCKHYFHSVFRIDVYPVRLCALLHDDKRGALHSQKISYTFGKGLLLKETSIKNAWKSFCSENLARFFEQVKCPSMMSVPLCSAPSKLTG